MNERISNGFSYLIVWRDKDMPGGTTVEDIIWAATTRLLALDRKLPCEWNKVALKKLGEAIEALDDRTANRKARGVEGTMEA